LEPARQEVDKGSVAVLVERRVIDDPQSSDA
jgi:hypothetical protein